MDAVVWGDAAYDNLDEVRDATRAEVWRRSIEAARALNVCMINPWNPPAGKKANETLKESLNPIKLVFYPVAGARYYGGSEVNLPAIILNDSRERKTLSLAFLLRDGQNRQKLSGHMGPFQLPPGQGQNVRIRFQLSEVDKVEDRLLCCTLLEQNGSGRVIRDHQEWPIRIHPDPPHFSWAGLSRLRLFDPQGNAARLFQAIGVGFKEVRTIPEEKENTSELLVIGPEALSGLKASEIGALKKRLYAKETCTLILAQDDYPLGLPLGLTLNHHHGSTLCFLCAPQHPALSGIADDDVQLWAGDHLVSRKDFNLPAGGGFRALLISGGTAGLRYTPLIEKQKEKGGTLFCQLPLVEKFWEEPSAALILFNILRYFESRRSSNCGQIFEETCCPDLPQDLEKHLQTWGILPEKAAQGDADRMLLFVRAANYDCKSKTAKEWLDWVKEGNVLWVSGIEPTSIQRLRGLMPDLKCVALSDDALPLKIDKNHLLAQGLLNQDFYWTEPHPICTYRFARLLKPSCWALKIQPENPKLPWKGLSYPAVLMTAHVGQGWLVVDTLDWSEKIRRLQTRKIQLEESKVKTSGDGLLPVQVLTCSDNQERAMRLFCGFLSNLGAQLEPVWGIKLEAENMSEKTPGQPLIRNRNHHYWAIFKNNYLAHDFDFLEDNTGAVKEYLIDVKACCRIKKSIPPRMKVLLDGKTVGECFVDKPFWRIYRFKTAMKGVKHRLEVHLVNNPEDAYNHRYLHVDWVEISFYGPGRR